MTDEIRGVGAPDGSPWSVDLLADLHAGVLDPAQSARLWAQVNTDPQARAVIDALDSVTAQLTHVRDEPLPPMPAHFAASLDAAIAAEARRTFAPQQAQHQQQTVAPVIDMATARRKRGRVMAWGVGTLTAAAAAVAVVAMLPGAQQKTDGSAQAVSTAPAAPEVSSEDMSAAVGKVSGKKDYGPLKDKAGLDKCLEANGIDPAKAQAIGVAPVKLDGKPGIMAMLTTGEVAKFRILVVESDCTKLFNDTIGG